MTRGTAARRRVNSRSEEYARYGRSSVSIASGRARSRISSGTGVSAGAKQAQLERNRSRATSTGKVYVVFLALISLATVFMCVYYLRLKATITAQVSMNEQLESRLHTLRSENDALYENVNNEVDWNYIKDVAIGELGMKYATEDQIVWYNTDDSSYIRQYVEVPGA